MEEQPITASINFRHSEQMDQVFAALAEAQKVMDGAKKDATNPHFRSKYADLESVMDACRVPLANNGLAVLQPTSANGAKVTVTTLIGHKSGQWIAADLEMTSAQNTPQGIGSTITYGRRYGLSSMVGIAPEDDDGTAGSIPGSNATQQYQAPAPRIAPPAASPAKTVAGRPAMPDTSAKPFDVKAMRSAIADEEKALGREAFMRVLGAEGFESVGAINSKVDGTRVYEAMRAESKAMKETVHA
jgi:hypothetical protein